MTVLIAVSCVVALAALTLFIIYMTTRRTSQQQPLVKTYTRAHLDWISSNLDVVVCFLLLEATLSSVFSNPTATTNMSEPTYNTTTLEGSSSTSNDNNTSVTSVTSVTRVTSTQLFNTTSSSLTTSIPPLDVTTGKDPHKSEGSNLGLLVGLPVVLCVALCVIIAVIVLLLRRKKRAKNESSSMEATETKDGEHIYDDVYDTKRLQTNADKPSDDTHIYYNEAASTTMDLDKKEKVKGKQNAKQNDADKNSKSSSAKEKKSKDKKSKPQKEASENGDASPYYNVVGIQSSSNGKGTEDKSKEKKSDKKTPDKNANNSKMKSTTSETHDDDDGDVSYTDETPDVEELYSKPMKQPQTKELYSKPMKQPQTKAASTTQKSDTKTESPKKTTKTSTTKTPPKPADTTKQQQASGNKKGENPHATTKGKTDDGNGTKGKNNKGVKKQVADESNDVSMDKQPKTTDEANKKTEDKVKDQGLAKVSGDAAAKSTGTQEKPGKKQNRMQLKKDVPSSKPTVHPKPKSIPSTPPSTVPTSPTPHENEYAYVTVPQDRKLMADAVLSDASARVNNEVNDTGGGDTNSNDIDDDDADVLYARLDHTAEQDEEYDIEDDGDDEAEVTYADIKKTTKPIETQAASVPATGDNDTVFIENDLYSS
ncbi:hypothetical protein LSAT2_011033 [Lamellibrachia satsuma]|nr:hypothetical protein LSAT2_011033 [Lamellibrachia satsuma]